ncbi:MAG: Fic family protein [Thermoplasmata archaeon]|nr:Fic family protein [Thermoplasmata archaeon]
MSYTEVKERGNARYFYRVRSVRRDGKVGKDRVYLGRDLSGDELAVREERADSELYILRGLLTDDEVEELERVRQMYATLPEASRRNRYEAFVAEYTHDSTAIEGNTLSLRENAMLLFDGVTPRHGELREVFEVLNHRDAIDLLLDRESDIDRRMVLELHRVVCQNTLPRHLEGQLGVYRTVQVRVGGTDWRPPAPEDVPEDMAILLSWHTRNRDRLHPVIVAAYFHVAFETIHPFVDGNGRVGRLLMNHILHGGGFPMVNIPFRERQRYYACLEAGQEGNLRPFVELLMASMRKDELMV